MDSSDFVGLEPSNDKKKKNDIENSIRDSLIAHNSAITQTNIYLVISVIFLIGITISIGIYLLLKFNI